MNNQKMVAILLEECRQILDQHSSEMEGQFEEDERKHQQIRDFLPDDLRTLIEEAKEMKWPFVPERWQYKQAVDLEDKTNLQDTINAKLQELLIYLKASVTVRDFMTAAAIVFVIDRFLYWVDGSSQLLQIAKRLHRLQPTTPIAPQLVIRQARISVNSGKLLKAEYILNSLINDSGATGVWKYSKESDRILVQSVCVQIRGQILQKLGLWYEAAELIWASILGYFTLPQPDKKGIATSLGILADIFVSMSENDYNRFKSNYQFHLNLLKEFDHRLLSAAEACKLAAAYSQFTPLFVLTAVNIRGTCLLSYSYSSACPLEKQEFYLSEAKESFEIGLLSKRDNKLVTSKQELHSFVKAAFCLTKVHQRLYGESGSLSQANQWCQEAIEKLYAYNHSSYTGEQDKEQLAKNIMCLVMSVKEQLQVQNFANSDAKSYVPDDYKTGIGKQIVNGELSFEKVLKMYSQHCAAVCEDFESNCKNSRRRSEEGKTGACITALKTETRNLDTMCVTEERAHDRKDTAGISFSQKERKGSEGFKSQMQIKSSHVGMFNPSCDEETESNSLEKMSSKEENMSNECQSRSEISGSLSSWSRMSKSSSPSSWEKISCDETNLPQDGKEKTNDLTTKEQDCCAVVTEEAEGKSQECSPCSLSSKTQQLFLQVDQKECTSPLKCSFQNNIAFTNRTEDSDPNFREESEEETKNGLNQLPRKGHASSKNKNDDLSDIMNPTSKQDSAGSIISSGIDSRTKDSNKKPASAFSNSKQYSTWQGSSRKPKNNEVEPKSEANWLFVDPDGDTVDTTEDAQVKPHLPDNRFATPSINSTMLNLDHGLFVQNWINKSITTASTGGTAKMHDVDPQAETVEDWDFASDGRKKSVGSTDQPVQRPETSGSSLEKNKPLVNLSSECATTKEDENEKLRNTKNSSHSSSSSMKSWYRVTHLSNSFSDLGSPSLLNSSGSSFVFMERTKEQIFQARILSNDDYDKLLAGVEHTWLVERLKNTGLFKPDLLHKAHSALLLKYSKKSALWTAQETAVYVGDYLKVAKKGKQRNAFWIHFLHQEETLGRYVGKEYKEEKELLHHFCDVERQMTAQYYVTEFNKRLYEQNISTQIFYVPSVVLLVLNGKHIQGCISVEPYILGEFVKLSNNTTVAKLEHKATEYGLAFGHFCYEFSQGKDVVVDLQGWVTGNGKGLIYLTDPQIHSLSWQAASCAMNFGKKGIYYFFNKQHTECNEICHRLSLRPSPEKLN